MKELSTLFEIAQTIEGVESERCVAYPCIAIIPVSAAANELGPAESRGGHKGTVFSTCEELERQRGAGYAFSPSSFIHGLASPLLPVSAGSLQLTPDERDSFVDRLVLRASGNEKIGK